MLFITFRDVIVFASRPDIALKSKLCETNHGLCGLHIMFHCKSGAHFCDRHAFNTKPCVPSGMILFSLCAGFELVTALPGDVRSRDFHLQLRPGAHPGQPAGQSHGWPTGNTPACLPAAVCMLFCPADSHQVFAVFAAHVDQVLHGLQVSGVHLMAGGYLTDAASIASGSL